MNDVKKELSQMMPTQNIARVDHFLGVDVTLKDVVVQLKQSKGIERLLAECQMLNSRKLETPLEYTIDYSRADLTPSDTNFRTAHY